MNAEYVVAVADCLKKLVDAMFGDTTPPPEVVDKVFEIFELALKHNGTGDKG